MDIQINIFERYRKRERDTVCFEERVLLHWCADLVSTHFGLNEEEGEEGLKKLGFWVKMFGALRGESEGQKAVFRGSKSLKGVAISPFQVKCPPPLWSLYFFVFGK